MKNEKIVAKLTVKMYTVLREKTGASTVELEAETIAEALDKLKEKFGKRFVLGESYILLLNDEIIEKKDFEKTKIKKGDLLHIFPPIAGGSLFRRISWNKSATGLCQGE